MPDIKASAKNAVPECVTPGRLMEYLKSRNPELSPRFESVPAEYMRIGEKLGVRWDYAFYQMILETGALSYQRGNRSGDVKPTQNNFAGLGATGGGEPARASRTLPTGVRAHLEHLLLYSGEKLENPIAERTRKVQEWGVLTELAGALQPAHHLRRPRRQVGARAAAATRKMLEAIAERFDAVLRQARSAARAGRRSAREPQSGRGQARAAVRRRARQARHRGGQGRRASPALRARRASRPSRAARPRRRPHLTRS